jgi:hypothetical protein
MIPRIIIPTPRTTSGLATAWNPAPNSSVFALVVSGGTVYAGGDFTSIGGQARNRIAALDAVWAIAPNAGMAIDLTLLALSDEIPAVRAQALAYVSWQNLLNVELALVTSLIAHLEDGDAMVRRKVEDSLAHWKRRNGEWEVVLGRLLGGRANVGEIIQRVRDLKGEK